MSLNILPSRFVISEEGSSVTVHGRGLLITDISRTGKVAFWKLAALFFRGRTGLTGHPKALSDGQKRLFDECTLFIVVAHYHVSKKFYTNLPNALENETLTMRTRVVGLTKSSLLCQTDIIDAHTDTVLAWLRFKYVCVNRESRRSMNVPQWFVEKYSRVIENNINIDAYRSPTGPDCTQKYTKDYEITPSDVDWNQHTNNTVYYRLFFDTATEASIKQSLFSLLRGDICQYDVLESKAVYLRECSLWDSITVTVWQDSSSPDTLHCSIAKPYHILFKASVTFYITAKL